MVEEKQKAQRKCKHCRYYKHQALWPCQWQVKLKTKPQNCTSDTKQVKQQCYENFISLSCPKNRWQNTTSCINFLQTGRISLLRVAENIITCLSWGVILKISCTSLLMSVKDMSKWITQHKKIKMVNCIKDAVNKTTLLQKKIIPSDSSILSHSSRTKCRTFFNPRSLSLARANILPGVPTTTWGHSFFSISLWILILTPP